MNKPTSPPLLPPPDHHWIPTEDGSWTIFSERFQEAAHSTHGAIAETKLRFLKGCCIRKRWLADPSHDFSIFEVGYGLGIGAIETFHLWLLLGTQTPVNFVSCEIDENLILWTKNHLVEIYGDLYPPEVFELLHNLQRDASGLFYESHYRQQFKLKIFVNDILMHQDFLEKNYPHNFKAIFQDAYSPKKNPTLWSRKWFNFLKNISSNQVILSTYSSSTSVQKNLIDAGFHIINGGGFGKKKSSTIAYLEDQTRDEIFSKE